MKALIVEDEKHALMGLKNLIKKFCSRSISEIKTASDFEEIGEVITEWRPDILFLDLQLQGFSGFDVLDVFGNKHLHVIITTAYDEYALKAFNYNTIHYLVKPINPKQLIEAVDRVKHTSNVDEPKYMLRSKSGIVSLPEPEILYLKAEGMYTTILMMDGSRHTNSKPLVHVLDKLTLPSFLRVHHSYVVNMQHFSRVNNQENVLTLTDQDIEVPVSVRKMPLVLAYLQRESHK